MSNQMSFSSLERKFLPKMRDGINHSEDKIDLTNHFAKTTKEFLGLVFEDNLKIKMDDVVFNPKQSNYYEVSIELQNSQIFNKIWNSSDLQHVIKRFADSTYHRYLHLDKHLEKTVKKIRN